MNTYKIISESGKTYRRIAHSAIDAIGTLCGSYGWRFDRFLFDTDTHGKEWAQALIARDGTYNWDDRFFAERVPSGKEKRR